MEKKKKEAPELKTKNEKYKTPNHQWQIDFLWEQFKKESDRAAVILTISIIDQALYTIIKAKLVPIPSSQDPLFDHVNSPFSSFSSKIDIAYRLGIISSKLCRDLHLFRKIRNSFAHDIFDCDFNNMSVKARVNELKNSLIYSKDNIYFKSGKITETREVFINLASAIIWRLNSVTNNITNINEYGLEWLYRRKENKESENETSANNSTATSEMDNETSP